MSPAEVQATLKRIITEVGAVASNPFAREARSVAAAVALLALVVADQERRIRALEPCPGADGAHRWKYDGVCAHCTVRRSTVL